MASHEEKVRRICRFLKEYNERAPLSLKKKAVSHEVPKPRDKRDMDRKVDISALNEILSINTQDKTCIAEPGVTFADLAKETMRHGLIPLIVPELKTITVGGAVAGCSIESMSFKYGGFHDTCLEYEIITANGEVLICTPDNENSLLFQMVHGTFGTLGIISRLKFKLLPAKPFVRVCFERYNNLEEYKGAIWKHYKECDIDFMDGIIHSPDFYVLNAARLVDEAPYTHTYDWVRVFHTSTRRREGDYLKTIDYFFRYDRGVTHTCPVSFIGRLCLRKFFGSDFSLRLANTFKRYLPSRIIPVTVDVFIPFSRVGTFLDFYTREVHHYPLWCVPYKKVRNYEWLSEEFTGSNTEELFIDLAVYGMKDKGDKNYYRIIEEELMKIGGIKTLISGNYYTEEEFWRTWNRDNYRKIKNMTDPEDKFRDLYVKTCLATRGLGR